MSRKSEWISASEVGRVEFCEKALELKYAGASVSTKAQAARVRGDQAHEQFNVQAKAADKRCFIASHVWGIDDPRTECLRQFRDTALMPNRSTRWLVALYYRLSPALVTVCRHLPIVDAVARWLCARVLAKLSLRAEVPERKSGRAK